MATYKSQAGNILQPGAQINRLSSYNYEGVYGWPGFSAYELIGYVPISSGATTSAFSASSKYYNLTIPSPDRRTDDRVRDNLTSMIVYASSTQPAYVYGASMAIAQDIPVNSASLPTVLSTPYPPFLTASQPTSFNPGFPANPVTADLQFKNTTEILSFQPSQGGASPTNVPVGIPATQATGINAASAYITAAATNSTNYANLGTNAAALIPQGTSDLSTAVSADGTNTYYNPSGSGSLSIATSGAVAPFVSSVSGSIANTDFANSMMYKITANTTWQIFNTTALTSTTANGGGVGISGADISGGRQAYIVCRLNVLQPSNAVAWSDIQGFIDFASQVGGNDS
jgi:hypothetical protein